MRKISISKLHEKTGKLVRAAATAPCVVTDRGRPVAMLGPVAAKPGRTPFAQRKLRPAFARMKPIKWDSAKAISEDRDRF